MSKSMVGQSRVARSRLPNGDRQSHQSNSFLFDGGIGTEYGISANLKRLVRPDGLRVSLS